MIVFVILALLIIAQIILRIVYNKKIKNVSETINYEMSKFENIENHKRKNALSTIVAFLISIIIFTFPVAINILFYMHFPVKMFVGKLNICFTFFLAYAVFMVANLIQYKIINCYIYEHKTKNPTAKEEELPNIKLKNIAYVELFNVFTTAICLILSLALYFVL